MRSFMEQCWHMYRAPDEANKITKKVVEGKKNLSDAMLNTVLPQICVDCHNGQAVLESTNCRNHPLSSCVCI